MTVTPTAGDWGYDILQHGRWIEPTVSVVKQIDCGQLNTHSQLFLTLPMWWEERFITNGSIKCPLWRILSGPVVMLNPAALSLPHSLSVSLRLLCVPRELWKTLVSSLFSKEKWLPSLPYSILYAYLLELKRVGCVGEGGGVFEFKWIPFFLFWVRLR